MKKEEIIHLHIFLVQIKKYFEKRGYSFQKYRELNINPLQIHRNKEKHKQAIFILASELASLAQKKQKNH